MEYVPPNKLTIEHVRMLEKSLEAAPLYERRSIEEIMQKLGKKEAMLFTIPGGIIVVSVMDGAYEKRLLIVAIYCDAYGANCRGIIRDLKRLAAEWKCVNIETCVYQKPLLKVILKFKGRVESVNMVMAVENPDGQQEDVQDSTKSDLHGGTAKLDSAGNGKPGQ